MADSPRPGIGLDEPLVAPPLPDVDQGDRLPPLPAFP